MNTMRISPAEATVVLDVFGFISGEGGLSEDEKKLVRRIFQQFPELANLKDGDGLPKHTRLLY